MTADDNAEEAIEASSATEPLRWPDPSRPIINQRPGAGGVGGGLGGGRPGGATGAPGGAYQGGISAPGGMPYRKKEEKDEEHHKPSFLEEPDPEDVFGTDGPTAPPVIGE